MSFSDEKMTEEIPAAELILKDAAVIGIATSLWNHRIQHQKPKNVYDLYEEFPMKDIGLPGDLMIALNECLKCMADEIGKWLKFHTTNVFMEKLYGSYDNAIPFLRNLVWRGDGKIDYAETDKRLRADPMLLESEKKKIEKVDFSKPIEENEELSNSFEDPYYADEIDDFF